MNYEIEELEQRIVELEGQNAFECGCVSEYKEKLDDAKRTLTSALQWLACPDDISELTGKCNEQNAFDEIRECLDRIK